MKIFLFCLILLFSFSIKAEDTLNRRRLRTVIALESGFYLAGNAYLQFIWYKDHDRVPFHFYNDNKGYLQMDKFGHAYSAYQYSRKGYEALRWAGLSEKKSLLFGGPLGLIMQTPIEIFDGLYEGYGFSNGDMIANTYGAALFSLQQAIWNRQIIKMKFSYSPSGYAKYRPYVLGDTPLESFFLDYNGHTYWHSLRLQDLNKNWKIPSFLSVSFGYSANGMLGEFSNPTRVNGNPVPYLERYREWVFSLDMDLSQIKTEKKILRFLLDHLNVLKIPFPAISMDRVNGLKFRPLYF